MHDLDFDGFQYAARVTAEYPGTGGIVGIMYTGLGVAGEAGEIANKIKKAVRNDEGVITGARRAEILDECGDVLWYIAQICTELNERMSVVANMNQIKLRERKTAGTIKVHR